MGNDLHLNFMASNISRNPSFFWMIHHPARILALGLGIGLLRPAPGTWGTALAWLSWLVLLQNQSLLVQASALTLAFVMGIKACHITGKHLGITDHSAIVIDEVVAFWLVLWLIPSSLLSQGYAFILFRLFDILKPQPIRFFDGHWKHGLGVMFDDILAGFYTLLVFAIGQRLLA